MQDKTLLKLAITASIVGMFAIFLVSEKIEPYELRALETHENGEIVSLVGEVKDIRNAGTVTILKIDTTQQIDVVVFEPIDIKRNARLNIVGEVSEYEGKKQVIANEIKT